MKYLARFVFISSLCICGFSSDKPLKYVPISKFYENGAEQRIIEGIPAQKGQFPWQVLIRALISSTEELRCGGSILKRRNILTAAHCIPTRYAVYRVYAGGITLYENETGRTIHKSENVFIHPKYDERTLENDVGIIVLATSILFNNDIKPIALPVEGQETFPDSEVQISGWGYTGSGENDTLSPILNWAYLFTISNIECQSHYPHIAPSTLCATGYEDQSVCYGDSGGPLVMYIFGTPVQVGIISFVSQEGCSLGKPSGFVRTESVLQFINGIINNGNKRSAVGSLRNISFIAVMLLKCGN